MSAPAVLSPSQQRTLDALRRSGDPVVFDPAFVAELTGEVSDALDHFAERLGDDADLWVSKHAIQTVLDCEARFLAADDFEWSPANAAGTVAHKAIELLIWWRGEPVPADLVDEAIARLIDEERGIGQWLGGLSSADEADLRGQGATRVTQFMEHFPPLTARFRPVTEARIRFPVDGPIILGGKVDLAFGTNHENESRKVIVDLKTGRTSPQHRQDLGFYALVETLRCGVPPRKVATFYLDAAEAQAEDVTEAFLRSAARRTLDGIHNMVDLELEKRPATRRPGASCRWCPLSADCSEGSAHLAALADT